MGKWKVIPKGNSNYVLWRKDENISESIFIDSEGEINYTQFVNELALNLAKILKKQLCQKRVSIVFPKETIMLGGLN